MVWRFIVFSILGFFLGAIGLSQILLIFTVTKPLTKKLDNYKMLSDASLINKRANYTLLIWITILTLSTGAICFFAQQISIIAYFLGIVFALFRSRGKLRVNEPNIQDYVSVNHQQIILLDGRIIEDDVISSVMRIKRELDSE